MIICLDQDHRSSASKQSGFTLLELLVALTVFSIISASIFGLLQIGRIDRNRSSRRSDVLKNARVAIHMIGRDALNAGLGFHRAGAVTPDNFVSTTLGVTADTDNERDLLTSIVAGNDLNPNGLLTDTNARTDTVAFCYRDMQFNDGDLVMLKNVASDAGTPTVPFVNTSTNNGAQDAAVHHLYLVESDTTQVAIMATGVAADRIEAAPGDPLALNQPLNGVGATGSVLRECVDQNDENCTTYVATAKRFSLVSYSVSPDGTLFRTVYGNNIAGAVPSDQVQPQPLAYNVENMQIEYVLNDGTVTDKPNAGADGLVGTMDDFAQGFNQIRQITVMITVQSTEIDEQTGIAEKLTLKATFSTRNMEYDAG